MDPEVIAAEVLEKLRLFNTFLDEIFEEDIYLLGRDEMERAMLAKIRTESIKKYVGDNINNL